MAKKMSFDDFMEGDNLLAEDEDVTDVSEEVQEEDEDQSDEPVEEVKPEKVKSKKEIEPVRPTKKKEKVVEQVEEGEDVVDEGEDNTDPIEDSHKFFEEVEKITGQSIDVDYGDVDPLTPQGVALREQAVKEVALDTFLEEMQEKFPQVFKALQHSYNGGDITELFTQTTSKDYSKITLKEDDLVMAKEVLKDYYRARGVKNETRINKLLETAEDSDEGLYAEAQAALDELKEEQELKTQAILETQRQKATDQKKKDSLLLTAVEDVIERKVLGGFKIPDTAEAQKFKKFVVQNIRRGQEGKYELVTPIEPTNMEKLLQYQYFQFKGGDLSKIIKQEATTQNVNRLKLKLQQEQDKVKKQTIGENRGKLSLNDFTAD